jgi:hypothetical protein
VGQKIQRRNNMDAIQYVVEDFTITVTPQKVTYQLADDILPAEAAPVDISNTTLGRLLMTEAAQHFINAQEKVAL